MNSRILTGLFILALTAIGCVTEFKANLPSGDQQILIVEGSIMADTTVTFQLSTSYPIDSAYAPQGIFDVDAKITLISDNGYESAPATYLGKGKYSMDVGTLDDNVGYGIKIAYKEDTYQSALSKPLHTPEIDSVSWVEQGENAPVGICVSTHDNDTGEPKFFLWDYAEDWEFNATYDTSIFFNPKDSTFFIDSFFLTYHVGPYYHCWRHTVSHTYLLGSTETLNENRIINKQLYQIFPGTDDRFTILYAVTINQRAISKSAYDYYQNKIKLNEEMGGLFTPQPSDVDGNISCITNPSRRAIGYIEVSKNTAHKRLFLNSSQIKSSAIGYNCTLDSFDDLKMNMQIPQTMSDKSAYAFLYMLGYRPALDPDPAPGPLKPSQWSTSICTDCTQNGGLKNKPDFWPNGDN